MLKTGTSYFGVRIPRHVRADMEQLKRQGFNQVTHTFNENDLLFYKGTMKEIVRITKDIGHEVYIDPWGVGKVFGGESFSNFVATNLDCLQMLSDGKPGGNACPMNPRFRAFMQEWIDAALDFGPDMIFWDEPHFSISTWLGGRKDAWGCRCDICKDLFHQRFGKEMPLQRTREVDEYLEWGIRDFLQFLLKDVKAKGGKNALCLLPHEDTEEGALHDWSRFAAMEGLDVFSTDPYFEFGNKGIAHVDKFAKKVADLAKEHNLEAQLWFQGFRIKSGREHLQAEAVDIAVKHGIKNLAVWGFEACDHMWWIRPDDPQKLWQTFVDKFTELRKRG